MGDLRVVFERWFDSYVQVAHAPIPVIHQMIDGSGIFEAQRTGHGFEFTNAHPLLSMLRLTHSGCD